MRRKKKTTKKRRLDLALSKQKLMTKLMQLLREWRNKKPADMAAQYSDKENA